MRQESVLRVDRRTVRLSVGGAAGDVRGSVGRVSNAVQGVYDLQMLGLLVFSVRYDHRQLIRCSDQRLHLVNVRVTVGGVMRLQSHRRRDRSVLVPVRLFAVPSVYDQQATKQ